MQSPYYQESWLNIIYENGLTVVVMGKPGHQTNQSIMYHAMVLVRQQGQSIKEQVTALPQLIQTGDIDIDDIPSVAIDQSVPKHHPKPGSHKSLQEVLDSSKVTKELAEILVSLEEPTKDPQFILIEVLLA